MRPGGHLAGQCLERGAPAGRGKRRLPRAKRPARKADFLFAMSDEMRTPLGAMAALASLAQRGGAEGEPGEHAGRIAHAAQQLLHMMNDVQDLNRIEA
ncbi:hypothetical protein LP420_03685 [Massilia sp. B-10]|nr:hypothetical protein LP420_03685 [Massilia sp. B-10]